MTPEQIRELQQLKIHLFECYITETKFAKFLMECLEQFGSGLPADETFKLKWFSDRAYALLQKIQASDARYHPDSSDDNVPMPFHNNP